MSWLFSQALVAEYSVDICSDGEPSAPSNGNPTPQAYFAPDRMTAFSRLSRFGMTCKPLTDDRGAALLTSYLADFRARTSVQQGGGKGITGERSGMWKHMARIVGEVRPHYVFVENSPLLVGRGLAVVIGDLAEMGYDAQWFCLSASECGAPHQRDRIWLVAHPNSPERRPINDAGNGDEWGIHTGRPEATDRSRERGKVLADACHFDVQRVVTNINDQEGRARPKQRPAGSCGHGYGRWPTEPDVGRVANGVAARVDRLKAIGNGQVPRVAATAFTMLSGR